MNTIHYWSEKNKNWVDRITQATKYKSKQLTRPGYEIVKFGKSFVVYFSEKDGFSHKNIMKNTSQQRKIIKNPIPNFDSPEKRAKFYSFCRDTLSTSVREDLSDIEIDALLNDDKTGGIITTMLVNALDLRRKNKALKTQLQEYEFGDTRTLANSMERRRDKELKDYELSIRDLAIKADIVKSEIASLSDLRQSLMLEVSELKENIHNIKNIDSIEKKLDQLREENEEELKKRSDLRSFDMLSNEISEKEARLSLLVKGLEETERAQGQFRTYDQLNKEVSELESMRRYLNSELDTRRSRATELLSEIESLTKRRDLAYREAVDSGSRDVPVPGGSTVAPVIPIQLTGRSNQPRTKEDPWLPAPVPPRLPGVKRTRYGDLEID